MYIQQVPLDDHVVAILVSIATCRTTLAAHWPRAGHCQWHLRFWIMTAGTGAGPRSLPSPCEFHGTHGGLTDAEVTTQLPECTPSNFTCLQLCSIATSGCVPLIMMQRCIRGA